MLDSIPAHKRKILVTGSAGSVGSYIASIFSHDKLFLTTKQSLDITDKKKILQVFNNFQPDIAIHLAAKTNVDECEKHKDEAYLINALGTQYIAEACKKTNTTLLYVSTGAVFNGKKEYFTEDDEPHPINIYGQSKLMGEKAVQKLDNQSIIVRAGWIIGGGPKEKKFISYILQQIKEGKKEVHVINDKYGTITYAKELVEYMKFLVDNNSQGIYHFGSVGACSRYEIVKYLVTLLKTTTKVTPVTSAMFVDRFFAPRPTNEVLKSIKLPSRFMRSWQESLADYVLKELQYA